MPVVTTRAAALRHVVIHARAARRHLDAGLLGPAIYELTAGRAHLGFSIGMLEPGKLSFASTLLRRSLLALGERLERAVAPRAKVPGYLLAGAVMEALSPLWDAHPDIGADALADVAANAAALITRRYTVTERA